MSELRCATCNTLLKPRGDFGAYMAHQHLNGSGKWSPPCRSARPLAHGEDFLGWSAPPSSWPPAGKRSQGTGGTGWARIHCKGSLSLGSRAGQSPRELRQLSYKSQRMQDGQDGQGCLWSGQGWAQQRQSIPRSWCGSRCPVDGFCQPQSWEAFCLHPLDCKICPPPPQPAHDGLHGGEKRKLL